MSTPSSKLLAAVVFSTVALTTGLAQADIIAGWDFQTTTNGGTAINAAPNTPTVLKANVGTQAGTASIYANGTHGASTWLSPSSSPQITSFGGTATNASGGESTTTSGASALALANSTANKFSIVFQVSMTGYTGLDIKYATQKTSTGFSSQTWAYSTDDVSFIPFSTQSTIATSFATIDLGVMPTALDNAANVYISLTVDGATATAGNNRFDNVNFNATNPLTAPKATLAISNSNTGGFDLLKGAAIATGTGTVTVTNSGNADGNYTDSSTGITPLTLSTASGTAPSGGTSHFTYTPTSAMTSAYGTYTTQVTVTPNGTSSDTPLTSNVSYFIGQVSASNANNVATFGTFTDIASVVPGDTLVGLASKVTVPGTPSGAGAGQLGSEAIILDGTNTTAGTLTVGEDWRARTQGEAILTSGVILGSDVLKLTGLTGTSYTLQMSYNPAMFGPNTAEIAEYIGGAWVTVDDLNFVGIGPYNSSADFVVGDYGFDPATNTAFVVLDNSGTFAVVPEPASLGLVGLGAVALLRRRKSR